MPAEQPSLLGGSGAPELAGELLRERGTRAAEAGGSTGTRLRYQDAIRGLAAEGTEFSAEDVRARAGEPLGSSPNAVGAFLAAAVRRGEIVAIGFTRARRPHGRWTRRWRAAA